MLLRHVRVITPLGLLRALRTHAGFSGSKAIAAFSFPPFMRHSWLGHPRLAMRLGKFGFSVSLSLRYHRFSYRLYGMIDNRQAHNHDLPFPYQRFQAIFLHRHITETGSLRSVNPTYTLYPINIAVQSHPIAFR